MHLQTAVFPSNFYSFSLASHCNRINFLKAKKTIMKLVTWVKKQNIHTSNIYNLNRILVFIFLQCTKIPLPPSLSLRYFKVSSLLQIQNLENIELFPKTAMILPFNPCRKFWRPRFSKISFLPEVLHPIFLR